MDEILGYSSDKQFDDSQYNKKDIKKKKDFGHEYLDFQTFLQKYHNKDNSVTLFICFPWNPNSDDILLLQEITQKILINEKFKFFKKKNNLELCEIWKSDSVLKYHISLYPNIIGKKNDIDRFIETFKNFLYDNSLSFCFKKQIDSSLIVMNLLQNENFKKTTNYIKFDLKPNLSVYQALSSNAFFICLDINFESHQSNLVKKIFKSVNEFIETNMKFFNLKKQEKRKSQREEKSTHISDRHFPYHISILKYIMDFKINFETLKELEMILSNVEVSEILKKISVYVNSFLLSKIDTTKQIEIFHMPI